VTARDIEDGEELCIFYGHNLWFQPAARDLATKNLSMISGNAEDGWGGLLGVDEATLSAKTDEPYLDGDPDEIIVEEELPFTKFKLPPEEEDIDTIRTGTLM
jgi:tRNA-specific adenosine deaminase 3